MGILDIFKKQDETDMNALDVLIDKIKKSDSTYLKEYVENRKYLDDFSLFNEENYYYLLQKLFECKDKTLLELVKKYYDGLVFSEEDIEVFKRVFDLCIQNNELFSNDTILGLAYQFSNKKILLRIYDILCNLDSDKASLVVSYIIVSRPYFVSEEAFLSRVEELKVLSKSISKKKFEEVIIFSKNEDQKQFGIYDIDEKKLKEFDEKIQEMNLEFNSLKIKLAKINNGIFILKSDVKREFTELLKKETKEYEEKYNNVKKMLDRILEESSSLGDSYIEKIRSVGEEYLSLLEKIIPESVKKVEQLNNNINKLTKQPELTPNVCFNQIKLDSGTATVSSFLDTSIKAKKRYKMALEAKNKDEVYHVKYDDVLKLIITGFHPMLVGPSGVGKTYSVRQIAKQLNLPLYNIGFVSDEHEKITGFIDASGNYQETDFYRAFKYGGICFFDEIDNSESKALIELNKILERTGYLDYIFPNGERVKAHPNFVVVAASNTWGDGSSLKYTAREMLDSSTLERFIRETYDRDEVQEKNILKGYENYYEFAIAFREQLKNHPSIRTDISTGSLYSIRDFLNSGIYTDEKIFEYVFRKNIDITILRNIYSNLSDAKDTNLGKVLEKVIRNG